MANPVTPFTVAGYVYDNDLTTLMTSGTVVAYNATTNTQTSAVTINAQGEYTLNLANLSGGYSTGDEIHLIAESLQKKSFHRQLIGASDTEWTQNMYVDYPQDYVRVVEEQGEILTLKTVVNSHAGYGQFNETETTIYIFGKAEIAGLDVDKSGEGDVQTGDLIVFISGNEANRASINLGSKFRYDSTDFRVRNVIKEKSNIKGAKWSHYMIHCMQAGRL